MIGRLAFAGLCMLGAATLSCARAEAATEFCPATVRSIHPLSGDDDAPASHYRYTLTALSQRTVEGTIIADTDHGWYAWRFTDLHLGSSTHEDGDQTEYFDSPAQQIAFPEKLFINHAWVTKAETSDEKVIGWAAKGTVDCEVPAYKDRGVAPTVERQQSSAVVLPPRNQEPPPASGDTVALPVSAPFSLDCAVPFKREFSDNPFRPEYPPSVSGLAGMALVSVALDERGQLMEAWLRKSSGNPVLDATGLRAARLSGYQGAVSYCQPVKSIYVFRAEFMPHQ